MTAASHATSRGGKLLTRTRVARLLIVSLVVASAAGCGWTQTGFDSSNTGSNSVEALLPNAIDVNSVSGLVPAWTEQVNASTGDHIVSRPVGVLGTLFVETNGSPARLVALNTADGSTRWSADLGSLPALGIPSPALWKDEIIAVSTGKIAAYDAQGTRNCSGSALNRTCAPLWTVTQFEYAGGIQPLGQPLVVVHNGVIFATISSGALVAFDAATGAQLWVGAPNGPPTGMPSVGYGKVFVAGSSGPSISGFDLEGKANCSSQNGTWTCLPIWSAHTSVSPIVGPAISNERVFTADGPVFDATGAHGCTQGTPVVCTPLWTTTSLGDFFSAAAVADGMLFATRRAPTGDSLLAYDIAASNCAGSPVQCAPTRSLALNGQIPSIGAFPPAIANGVLYIGIQNALRAYDAKGVEGCTGSAPKVCQPLWQLPVIGAASAPIVFGGTLYVSFSGAVHAYRLPSN